MIDYINKYTASYFLNQALESNSYWTKWRNLVKAFQNHTDDSLTYKDIIIGIKSLSDCYEYFLDPVQVEKLNKISMNILLITMNNNNIINNVYFNTLEYLDTSLEENKIINLIYDCINYYIIRMKKEVNVYHTQLDKRKEELEKKKKIIKIIKSKQKLSIFKYFRKNGYSVKDAMRKIVNI